MHDCKPSFPEPFLFLICICNLCLKLLLIVHVRELLRLVRRFYFFLWGEGLKYPKLVVLLNFLGVFVVRVKKYIQLRFFVREGNENELLLLLVFILFIRARVWLISKYQSSFTFVILRVGAVNERVQALRQTTRWLCHSSWRRNRAEKMISLAIVHRSWSRKCRWGTSQLARPSHVHRAVQS
jgi:hypothetical protein